MCCVLSAVDGAGRLLDTELDGRDDVAQHGHLLGALPVQVFSLLLSFLYTPSVNAKIHGDGLGLFSFHFWMLLSEFGPERILIHIHIALYWQLFAIEIVGQYTLAHTYANLS